MRHSLALSVMAAAALAAAPTASASEQIDMLDRPSAGGGPGNAQKRGTGSAPVPGGGARERARRLAKMSLPQETE